MANNLNGRYYDASWLIPDEEAEYRWQQEQERSLRKSERIEEVKTLVSGKKQRNTA